MPGRRVASPSQGPSRYLLSRAPAAVLPEIPPSHKELVRATSRRLPRWCLQRLVQTTATQQVTVPVRREEEVVVGKRAVPKERVRLDTETVTDRERGRWPADGPRSASPSTKE